MANIKLQTVLNEPSQAAQDLPFYNQLPKDKVSLYKWRIYVLTRCISDAEFRADIEEMCRQDLPFFAATFCWAHETRDDAFTDGAGKFPFMPWPDQVDILAWFQMYGGKSDITVEKTRGIGLSWCIVIFLLWKWLFHGEHLDYGILSKDETSLDLPRRPATLMGKLDLLFENLPGWWQLDSSSKSVLHRTHSNHRFAHRVSNNAILGYTSSDDKLRSARVNLLVGDEAAFLPVDSQRWLASSQFISSSRILISTHDGTATMFYRMTVDEKSDLVRISTWWQDNPVRWSGAYVVKAGQVQYVDKDYKHEPDYEFCYDYPGLLRSPWVDGEFRKTGADEVSLMQEIYGTAAIDTKKLMQREVLDIAERSVGPASYRCRLNAYGEFIEDLEGEWHFWQDISLPFSGMYYVGIDPAIGVADRALAGVAVIDVKTGLTICTAALASCPAVELARAVDILCKKLCGTRGPGFAIVVPESTGIGVSFMTELKRLRWPSIYVGENKKHGIHNRDKGEMILIEVGRAIRDGELVISDPRLVDDFEHFEYNSKVELVFTGGVGHGDLGQACALAWWAGRERRRQIIEAETPRHDATKQPIELEAGYGCHKRRNWSDRFSSNHNQW
jgi:hypothetical protein